MNKRIEKLAEQAGIWKPTHDHKTWVRGEYISSPGELEKFAELLIRECVDEIKYLRKKYDTHRDVEPEENDWYVDAFLQAEDRLKEHFGVEEK